ncbi:MAG: branched-chain amino acid ABC transporter permease [Paracoccaceae bacterium]|jgi:branched-chain amino acid transport system permease protein
MLIVQQILNGIMLGGIYVGVAVAFTLTIGILNFLNFTIPVLFMLSGMIGWSLSFYGLPFGLSEPLGWLPSLGIGIICAILASLVVERFTYRYFKAKHGDATEHAIPLVSSLGFLLIFEYMVLIAHGSDPRGFHTPFDDLDLRFAGLVISIPQILSLVVSLAIVAGLSMLLRRTQLGRALRATAENPDAAVLMGIEVNRIVPVVFVLTGLLCGLAGALFAVNYGEVSPYMGDQVGTKAIAGMVIGGLGSVWGAIAGGLIVGLTETLSIHFFGATSAQITVWGLLLVLLLFRPKGLFGHNAIGKGKF